MADVLHGVEVRRDAERGRHVVASQDLEAGELIAAEQPAVALVFLSQERRERVCFNHNFTYIGHRRICAAHTGSLAPDATLPGA